MRNRVPKGMRRGLHAAAPACTFLPLAMRPHAPSPSQVVYKMSTLVTTSEGEGVGEGATKVGWGDGVTGIGVGDGATTCCPTGDGVAAGA
jgi:hypothetical protein